MKYKIAQNQRILLKLALTPQMRQSIALLGMATKDLLEYVDTAVAANPFLKKEVQYKGTERGIKASKNKRELSDEYDYRANIPQEENQRLALISQVRMLGLEGKILEAAEYLIYEMNDNGYIEADLKEAAEALSTDLGKVEKALEAIQKMDPPGIGAGDVRECLQLQLKRQGKENSLEYLIVTKFITELASNEIDKISIALKSDRKKVKDAISNIKKLNPRPASTILAKEAQRVVPDLIAEVKDKNINLALNSDWLPQLEIHNPYKYEPDIAKDAQAKKFIKENMVSAKFLIDNLRKRQDTIYKVADYIVGFQVDGFNENGNGINTLTISEVAKALNMHPSTISRTVSNKYIQINGEVVCLKTLLSGGIKKRDGEIISKTNIKKKIETIINNEDKIHPLSDEEIRKRLEIEGIKMERRTIAKYRESIRILPAYLRRKAKSASSD